MTAAIMLAVSNPMFGAAVENARHDLPVYPAKPRAKAPLHKGWQRRATTKLDSLAKDWMTEPNANVGIVCRGITVLDADSARGEDALADLGLPPTTTVRTRRGVHMYFAGNAPTARLLEDVEARGMGSGVLGAGSVHPTGFEYVWEIPPWEVAPAPIPGELRDLIDKKPGRQTGVTPGPILQGERNVRLLKLGGALRGRHGIVDVATALHAINQTNCVPPLPDERVEELAAYVVGSIPGAPIWILDPATYCTADPRLSRNARIVLRLLCDHARADGWSRPGIRRMAEMARMRRNTVVDATFELEAAGRIEARRSKRGNRYRLLPWTPSVHQALPSVPPSVTLAPEGVSELRAAA